MTKSLVRPEIIHKCHSIVELGKDTVTKTTRPDLMRIEVEKTCRAFEISQKCGKFRVPRVLDFDENAGVAVFERLHGIQAAGIVIRSRTQAELLVTRLATSLAIIHKELRLPDHMVYSLPTELQGYGSEVFIHGDVNTLNVCFDDHSSLVVILDWQMTGVYGGQATYGTRYFDLVWFIQDLIYRPRIKYLFGNPLAFPMKVFLETYCGEAEVQYDRDEFVRYAREFFLMHSQRCREEKNASRRYRYLWWRSYRLAEMFLHSLEALV